MIVYNRRINMVPGEVPVYIHMSQYDTDVVLQFELYASEGTFVVEQGTTALIRGTKPDGNGISLDAEIETEGGITTVTVEVIQQMTAVAGKSLYELSLRKSGEELNTANFVLDIERAPLDAETLPSESVIKELVDVIDQADEIMAAAEEVKEALEHGGLSDDAKTALLACFEHVAWIDEHGQDYYDTLYEALYNEDPPAPSRVLYQLQDLFVSNGQNGLDTEIAFENGNSYSICARIVITEDAPTTDPAFIFSNRDSAGASTYEGLHVQNTGSGTNLLRRMYGLGLTYNDDRYVKNIMLALVATFDGEGETIAIHLKNTVSESIVDASKTLSEEKLYNGKNVILGYHGVSVNQGFKGSVEDFVIKSGVMTSNEIGDYLSGNYKKYTLLTAIGDITTNGDNPSETRRLRCMDYIEVSGSTITMYGCPFAPSFYEYNGYESNNAQITSAIVAFRCYDSSKSYLSSVNMIPNNIETHSQSLPSGTKYVRFIIQKAANYYYDDGFSDEAVYPLTINGVPYYLREV